MGQDELSSVTPCNSSDRRVNRNAGDHPTFLADRMLGKLARWLRLMGYDTEYADDLDDRSIAKIAVDEGRILLTRDKALHSRKGIMSVYVDAVKLEDQLHIVAAACGLEFDEYRMRCSLCNGIISVVPPERVSNRIDGSILSRHSYFYICSSCGKIYWRGSHWEHISNTIGRALAEPR